MGRMLQKLTIWEEYEIEDSLLEDADLTSESDIDDLTIAAYDSGGSELMYDTIQDMTLKQNEGFSTIELYHSNGTLLYQNGKS